MSTAVLPGLAGAEAPPLSLPGRHFAAGVVFLVSGGVGLVVVAPDLAAGAFLSPRVVAVTHLFTLGWITTSIMGALYQLLPVALGASIRWPRVAHATFAVYVPGLAAFVAGMALGRMGWVVAGASTFGTGIALFVVNLAATLRRSRQRDVTWWALAAACSFLALTLVVGWALAANLRWGFMGGGRLVALGTHLHIAVVGWVLMVMVGVAQRLLPMFLLSHGADERPARVAVASLAAGVLLLFALHHLSSPVGRWIPAAFILVGVAAFLVQARAFYRHRRRPSLDPGMRIAAASLGLLAVAALLGGFLAVAGFLRPNLATGYVVLLVLGITVFVAAHYYKIVPFLVWLHRWGPLAGKEKVPTVADLYSARWASAAGVLLLAGVAGLASGAAAGLPPLTRVSAGLFTAGTLVVAAQMAVLIRRRPA